jgi:hypothetical protein
MNVFGGNASQGVEASLSFNGGTSPIGIVFTSSGGFGIVRTTVDADSIRFLIPFERLDNDDGNLTITAIIGSTDRPTDWIPNGGVLTSHMSASPPSAGQRRATMASARLISPAVFASLRSAPWAMRAPPR